MPVLLTGAAGFIGYKVCELLLKNGYDVVGVDNLNAYYDRRLKRLRLSLLEGKQNFRFIKLDIENKNALKKLFAEYRFDGVINLAARAGVRYSIEKPDLYFATNALGMLNLLQCMKDYGVKKIVLASTSSLYSGHKVPYSEDMNTEKPLSPYAASKKSAEVMLYTYRHLFGIEGVILRYFTVYGPMGRPDMSYFRFIKLIDEGKPIELYGDGSQRRDFTYVDDIAEGTVKAFETKGLGYEIINLGNNNAVELKYIIELIEHYLNKKAKINQLPFHKADMFETCADIKKALELLNWSPKVKVEEGIKNTVEWYKLNKISLKDLSLKEGDENNRNIRIRL